MPELPDIVVYLDALEARLLGARLLRARVLSPFVLRSVGPPIDALENQAVRGVSRLGKRIVLGFDDELFLVGHLMDRRQQRAGATRPLCLRFCVREFHGCVTRIH